MQEKLFLINSDCCQNSLFTLIDFDETCDKNKTWVLLRFDMQPISQTKFPLMFLYTTFTRPQDGMGCITPATTS